MTPETLTTVRRGSTAAEVEALCAATGYSRFPVEGDDGELLGYLHIKDVLETDEARRAAGHRGQVDPAVRDGHAPTTCCTTRWRPCSAAARTWPGSSTRDGATLGVATLEDVIEELVGEIRDAAHLEDGVCTSACRRTTKAGREPGPSGRDGE